MKKIQITICMVAVVLISGMLIGCKKGDAQNDIDLAMQLVEGYQYEEAMTMFEKAEEDNADPQMLARGRGIASLGLTNYEDAIGYFEEALSYSNFLVDELDFDLNYYLAEAYEKNGDLQKAKEVYKNILELRPDEVNALFLRGKMLLAEGDYKNASSDFKEVTRLDKDSYELRIEIAGLLSQSGYQEEGKKYLSDFLAKNEKKLVDYDKGRIYYYMGDYENARIFLEKAKADRNENTILLLGKTYEQLGDFNYATSEYKNYLLEHDDSAIIYNQLGLCKLQSGEYEEARKAFENAINVENNGMEKTLEYNLIVACEYAGDFEKASVLMRTYLKKYPDDENAVRENEFLKSR